MDDQLDPLQKVEIALLRAEHQKRYLVQIAYLKELVGEGIEYENSVVKVVVSEQGAYYELKDLPEEFSGAVGEEIERHFLTRDEAIETLTRAVEATKLATFKNTRMFSLFVLYTRRGLVDRKNCYIYDFRAHDGKPRTSPLEVGHFQPDVLPLFYKIRIDAEFAEEIVGARRGIVFCMANAGDRHLLIRILLDGKELTDLSGPAESETIH
jgi:hypothetical protein